ncbi:UDP-N-acetylglucosamine 1-carboxyvinyltransferase [Occallatibacter riparius]|uniref:UDP-N-acetylglucosamine 1-carboxyvinyltransferase n=1 Tax=Occallatibacter riparius TaxID=1002689 RepID=A0A9J7BKG7_9BACT|nr:UDP-N-acetylglucosamine 1-carboxyvinyltransferase [Occallatibacter riparius]UWZ83372.1 UDP-N-acetylglucosamine 1-carboxyvinyltransferase [Occallatibacter riparius]
MDKFLITGGRPLTGTIHVSGAKNSALPCMAAAILTEGDVILENIPQVRDIDTERKLLASMGAEVELWDDGDIRRTRIRCATLSDPVAKYEIVKTMRASSLVLGPLVARTGLARVAMPGGCAIGGRPIDLHLKGLEKMGAAITTQHGYIEARADRLRGAHIVFDKITVTGTEDLLMAAVLADGETVMENCAREPEVIDLAALLTAMGARIHGAGTSTIRVQGVTSLSGARHRIFPDRIEAGTFLIAGAITAGDLIVADCNISHLGALIAKLQEVGVRVDTLGREAVRVRSTSSPLQAADISTEEYPGFPTDMQAQYMALATQADGVSIVKENIFENRFMHVQELARMGANIRVEGRTATVRGKSRLSATNVMCSDLRASASLVLAALVADGQSVLDRVYHMDRGYERIEEKLRAVGAKIARVSNVPAPQSEEALAG